MIHPDLLHEEPLLRADQVKTKSQQELLAFGFARGVDRDRLLEATEPKVGESDFEPSVFSQDLFLGELIERCFKIVVSGRPIDCKPRYFHQLITHPPRDRRSIDFRCRVHTELQQDSDRISRLGEAYLALVAFRDGLCDSSFNQRSVGVRRRIDILITFKTSLEALHRACAASSTGLKRVADWVESVQKNAAYEALTQLLDFEGGRSVLETRLQAGYDGTLRRLEIVRVSRTEHRAFPRGAFARFFRRVFSLLQGYRFSEEDVMSQVLDDIFGRLEDEVIQALGLMQQIEFYLRASYFRRLSQERGYSTCIAEFGQPHEAPLVRGLFNPWLLAHKGERPVPCNIGLEPNQSIVIVTGPNSGGKTRLLQSLAVAQLLAQTGLPVPAESARLVWVEQLFLSMIEHVHADQAEGRLGLELTRIRRVFESSGGHSLILMDELCSGTNPSEGERIFEMVLDLLKELGAQVWITTHFLDFALAMRLREQDTEACDPSLERKAASASALAFLQVELDAQQRPTFQFVPGVAETSLARNTAARLGVTREELKDLVLAQASRPRPL